MNHNYNILCMRFNIVFLVVINKTEQSIYSAYDRNKQPQHFGRPKILFTVVKPSHYLNRACLRG